MNPDHQDVPAPQVNVNSHDYVDAVDFLRPDRPPTTAPHDFRYVFSGPLTSKLGETNLDVFHDIFSLAQDLVSKKPGCLASAGCPRYPDITEMRLAIHGLPEWGWQAHTPTVRYEACLCLIHQLRDLETIIIKGPFTKSVNSAVIGLRDEICEKIHIFDHSETLLRDRMDRRWLFRQIILAREGVTTGTTEEDMFTLLRGRHFDWVSSTAAISSQVGFELRSSYVRPETRSFR